LTKTVILTDWNRPFVSQFERDKALEAGDDAEKVAALEEEISLLEEKLAEGRLGLGKLSNINKRNKNNNYQTTNKAGEEVRGCMVKRVARLASRVPHRFANLRTWKKAVGIPRIVVESSLLPSAFTCSQATHMDSSLAASERRRNAEQGSPTV
jgi:hypothetical protein